METIVIETDRLLLRGITPEIIRTLFSTRTKEEIIEFFGTGEEEYVMYKEWYEGGMETHRFTMFFFIVADKENGRSIGKTGFHTINKKHRRAEMFYILNDDSDKRKGYMTEVLPYVLEYGFNALGLHRIKALVADWNTPSLKLLARHGFTFEGTMREDYFLDGENTDSDCYSLLKWEWEERKEV